MKNLVIIVNGGLYFKDDMTNVFKSVEEVKSELVKWNGGKDKFTVDEFGDDVLNVDELFDEIVGGAVDIYEINMCEMGDDGVTVRVDYLTI